MSHRYFWDLLESVTGIESWRDPPRFGSSSFDSKGVVLSVPLSVPLKSDGKELNKESVGLIAYVAAKAAGEIGLSRTEFLNMCNDEFSKAVPPPPPKPSEDKAYSEADIFAALKGLRPEASEEVVNRLKKLKSAEKKDDK